jgi:hypothetical protein
VPLTSNGKTTLFTTRAIQKAALLAFIYVALIILLPIDKATTQAYHLTDIEYRTRLFMVMLPSIVAWLAAFIGYAKLRQYAYYIRKTPEGPYFDKLATGCAWLAWSMPISAMLSILLNAIEDNWSFFYSASIIINNYLYLLLALIAFSILGIASRGLVTRARLKHSLSSVRIIILLFLVIGVLYCYMIFRQFGPSSLSSTQNVYYLPIWLVIMSIVIPYLYTWFIGLLAAYEITLYSKHTSGVLYRQALLLLGIGLVAVIISSIALQYIGNIQPRAEHLVIGYHLILASTFRIIAGGGYVLIVIGATRLKKIEEV